MNILHLSDIHFGRNNPKYGLKDSFSRHDQILDELIEMIAGFQEEVKPEHILFTGDITWMGKTKEFDEAVVWFKKLLKACNLTGKDISFCVGNHDLDLSGNYTDLDLTNREIEEMDELYRYENVQKMEPYLYAYNKFCEQIGMEPYIYPCHEKKHYSYSVGYKDVKFCDGKIVRLVSLDTALMMTQRKVPEDQMWLGQEQIRALVRYGILPADKNICYTIALMHHPDRFLHPNETSNYDGRVATLPILLQLVDLLVCGHSESCGRPRINRQLGGGTVLSGGAAYYSDDHINSFSMIYISEKKRMAYIPYIYENGWKDYEFEDHEIEPSSPKKKIREGRMYRRLSICCQTDQSQFQIPCDNLEVYSYEKSGGKFIHIDNEKDIMNCYRINFEFDPSESSELPILLNPERKQNTEYLLTYQKYVKFVGQAKKIRCSIITESGEILFSFDGCRASKISEYDTEFLEELLQLEKYFDVKFRIPDVINEEDLQQIQILKKLVVMDEKGYRDYVKEHPQLSLLGVTISLQYL